MVKRFIAAISIKEDAEKRELSKFIKTALWRNFIKKYFYIQFIKQKENDKLLIL